MLTDSGDLQEEAPTLGKTVLVLREATERPEEVRSGTIKIVGNYWKNIYEATIHLLDDARAYISMSNAGNPFGDGFASKRMLLALLGEVLK